MERSQRRVERNLKKSNLPDGKKMDTLDQNELPAKIRRQISVLLEGGFVDRAENILAFGLPGRGKSHLLCAIARELIIHKDFQSGIFQLSSWSSSFSLPRKSLLWKLC